MEIFSGFNLKVARLRQRLTQWELARLTDISPHRISAIERGAVAPRPEELIRIGTALTTAAKDEPA
jgi:DNA-binding XRE family transcriptional regulator